MIHFTWKEYATFNHLIYISKFLVIFFSRRASRYTVMFQTELRMCTGTFRSSTSFYSVAAWSVSRIELRWKQSANASVKCSWRILFIWDFYYFLYGLVNIIEKSKILLQDNGPAHFMDYWWLQLFQEVMWFTRSSAPLLMLSSLHSCLGSRYTYGSHVTFKKKIRLVA